MIIGNAKGYTKKVVQRLKEIGYRPQLFLINAADCDVPQRRERLFFCALRNDIKRPSLVLAPNQAWISAQDAIIDLKLTEEERKETAPTGTDKRFWKFTKPGQSYKLACLKIHGKGSFFNHQKLDPHKPACTLPSQLALITHWYEIRSISYREAIRLGSFPDDYQAKTPSLGKYMIGMSVPPKMTEQVAKAVIEQWLS